ncbi:MAG: ATP-binding protein [Chitinispirillia bacterium]|nr:ATP-binding protein [Chitinispirillia bacterium]
MSPIISYTRRALSAYLPYVQVVFVFMAFGLMVFASYLLCVDIEKTHLKEDTASMAEYIGSQIAVGLRELDTVQSVLPETEIGMFLMDRFSASNRGKYNNNWLLLNENLIVIAHFDSDLVGKPLREVPGGLANLAEDLEVGDTVYGRKMINHIGESKIISVGRLENGWHLGVATLADRYYQNLHKILAVLIILGLIMASGLSVTLMRISRGKSKAEERTKIMLNASPYGINILDRQYRILDCNQAALNMFGVADRDEYKANFHKYSPEFQPNGILSDEWRVTAFENVYRKNGAMFEWTHQKPDGELLPLEITFVCSTYEGQGIYIAYMRDLRQEKEMEKEKEKAITEKEALVNLANILNGIDVMIYVTDPVTAEILFMNDTMKRHYSIEGDCIGMQCYKVLQKDHDERCSFCPCRQLEKEPEKTIVWEERSTLTGRIYRNVDRYIAWPSGQKVHIQHSVDTTELVAAREAAEQSSRYKSAFLANMSHEIRTPMNAILGIAEIQLRDEKLTSEAEEAFGKIYESGDLLISIINDILDLSKIEAGKMELAPVKYDIPSLINDTAQLNRLRYESKPILFNIKIDENTPFELFGDELRIKQVLNNVLSNAFKYTDEGSIDLTIHCEPAADVSNGNGGEKQMLVFRVSDTGQGMTKEEINKLFDEYTRFNAGANRTTMGAGLGMSITMRLVEMMNGTIDVESEPAKGSVFTVRLPQQRVGTQVCGADLVEKLQRFRYQSMSISKKAQFLREYMPYGSVLVVDDVESNVYVAKGMLVPYGLKVATAASGFEAIDKIKRGNVYDIVFMDHMMPRMDGLEAVKKIRDMGYTNTIIALTANALIGREDMFLRNGFDGFISKPIDSRELNHVLNDYIRNRKPPEVVEAARRDQREREQKSIAIPSRDITNAAELKMFFVRDAENAVAVLNRLVVKRENLNETDVDSYITIVHGMKSALANIGERRLSGTAFRLELAGKARDFTVMSKETPPFVDEIRTLIAMFKPAEEFGDAEISVEDETLLREKLRTIKEACEAFDTKTANAALSDLKQKIWPGRVNKVLNDISAHLLHSSFEEAAAVAGNAAV